MAELSLEEFIARMRTNGQQYGKEARRRLKKPKRVADGIRYGNTVKSEETKARELAAWIVVEMWRQSFLVPDPRDIAGKRSRPLSEFLNRYQDEIDRSTWNAD